MVIAELFEMGLLDMFLYRSEPYVWIPAYFCVLLGMMIQFVLLEKSSKKRWHMSFLGMGLLGIGLCECVWYMKTGWGRLLVDMTCLLLLSLLLGALIAFLLSSLKDKALVSSDGCHG